MVVVNKGNSEFPRRIEHIKDLIDKHRPKIVVINELNIPSTDKFSPWTS